MFIRLSVLIFSLFFFSNAQAYPVDGWYWDPNEPGRGLNIELQDDVMFLAFFHYDQSGNAIWWIASGDYDWQTQKFSGDFLAAENGQCPGCPWSEPDFDDQIGGSFTLTFNSMVSATLDWQGGRISLIRTLWRFDLSQMNTFLYGDFHVTRGHSGIYFGDRLRLSDSFTGTDGAKYVSGRIIDGSSQRQILARHSDDNIVMLVDASTSHYQFYEFDLTKDRWLGRAWTYRKENSPSGNGLPFIGHRTASRASASGAGGPSLMSKKSRQEEPESSGISEEVLALELWLQSSSTLAEIVDADKVSEANAFSKLVKMEQQLRIEMGSMAPLDNLE